MVLFGPDSVPPNQLLINNPSQLVTVHDDRAYTFQPNQRPGRMKIRQVAGKRRSVCLGFLVSGKNDAFFAFFTADQKPQTYSTPF